MMALGQGYGLRSLYVQLFVYLVVCLLLLGPRLAVSSHQNAPEAFIQCAGRSVRTAPACQRPGRCHLFMSQRRWAQMERGHAGGSVGTVGISASVDEPVDTPPSRAPPSASRASNVDSGSLEARLLFMEGRLRVMDKQLQRVETLMTRKAAKKSFVINYDIGPDAAIDTGDVAKGAAAAFGLAGMILARSVAKNLWLVGGVGTGLLAAWLCREEEGGALSDTVRGVGYEVAVRARQYLFMWRTGKLSYVYFKRWEELDKKYDIMKKVEAMKALSLQKYSQAKEAEKKYQVGNRLMGFCVASVHLTIDTTQKLLNAKDREELILKLPRPLRNLLTTKEQRKQARLKKYRVKWCGMREWRPYDDE